MKKFPEYHTFGKTEFSEWDCYLRYPKFKDLSETISTHEVDGGKIYFTDNSQLENFYINHKIERVPF